ncbi:MAG: 2-oxo acid dehydrogenase subunit E2 [Trebonia sp.]|jgi:pyruvate dehydrogenase E2 component (dihydrolipoamide acetyltransferase)
MATVVRMPSVLAGATEAAIANWLVQPGDTVAAGTPIAEIETEKALVEYAAEEAGVIGRLVLAVGGTGEIGDPIAVLISSGETDADIDAALGDPSAGQTPASADAAADPGAPATLTSSAVPAAAVAHVVAPAEAAPPPAAAFAVVPAATPAAAPPRSAGAANGQRANAASDTRIFASPLVRKVAGEKGVDLTALAGTGPNGRIVRRDLEHFLAARPAQAPAAAPRPAPTDSPSAGPAAPAAQSAPSTPSAPGALVAGTRLIPHTPMRRAIARRLSESKATVPHFYLTTECVVDDLLTLRGQVNEAASVKVSVNDFVIMAAAAAFRDVPEANVTWSDEGLLAHENVDISIAVATEGGLVTPVLRGADRLRLSELARSAADLAQRARDRRLRQAEIEGGTFAISNLGMYGTAEFAAIINPPQSGILAVGAAKPAPVVVAGAVTAATVMRCTLSVDHRAIDGALAARWLAAFTARLEHPLGAII